MKTVRALLPVSEAPEGVMKLPLSGQYKVLVVGEPPLTLWNRYDERQAWLPFVRALVVYRSPDLTPEEISRAEPRNVAKRKEKNTGEGLTRRWATGGRIQPHDVPGATRLYHHEKGVDQIVLPFPDHRRIGAKEFKRLSDCGYPGFERIGTRENERLPVITYPRNRHDDMVRWCINNCVGRFHLLAGAGWFEKAADAVMAKLAIPL